MIRDFRGFSLTELAAVVCVLFVVTFIALPKLASAREDSRERELTDNIHTIQIALERYAADSGGIYPLILYGGDRTDTFVDPSAPVNPSTGYSYYLPPENPAYQPFPGDMDVLIHFGYMSQYPSNPFINQEELTDKIRTDPAVCGFGPLEFHFGTTGMSRVNIWSQPYDRALRYVRRDVGGWLGNLMWDTSEGQRHAPFPVYLSDAERHWSGFLNPSLPESDEESNVPRSYSETPVTPSQQFPLSPGNFYYYTIFEGIGSYSAFLSSGGPDPNAPLSGIPIGYHLVGFGSLNNLGEDYYNLWGDFEERSLMTVNEPLSGQPNSFEDIYVGPDGRPDGVFIEVNSYIELR